MGISLINKKDCKKCDKALICGIDNIEIECNSTDSIHKENFEKDGRYCAYYCKGYREASKEMVRQSGNIELNNALPYILAGNSEFILHSTKTNQDFYYKMKKKEKLDNKDEFIYFLNVKQGKDWSYAGVVWYDNNVNQFKFSKGVKGNIEGTDLNIRSLLFVINKLNNNELPQHCLVFHTGRCGVCGKKLTTPESILTGLGPSCAKRVGIPRVSLKNKDKNKNTIQ